MKISKYFTREECTRSTTAIRHGIKNSPTPEQWKRIALMANKVMDIIREATAPIFPTSVFRTRELNSLVGGSMTSQHCEGEAWDFLPSGWTVRKTMRKILELGIPFDQMIDEYGSWVHISYTERRANRGQILQYRKVRGKTVVTTLKPEDI